MRFRCIISYRSASSSSVSSWRTSVQGTDIVSVTAKLVELLKRRQRRPITVVGMYLQVQEAESAP